MFAQLKEKTVWTAIVRLGVFFFVFLLHGITAHNVVFI